MSKEEFLIKYMEFLKENNISAKSAKSYVSYLNGACKNLPGVSAELFDFIADMSQDGRERFCENLMRAITTVQQNNNTMLAKKTLNNYHSAVNMLIAFINSDNAPKGAKTLTLSVDLIEGASYYDKKDIMKNFLARLKTQDRFYYFGCFPIRLINKIATAYKKGNLFNELINSTNFIYGTCDCLESPLKIVQLKDIEGIFIKEGKAYISVNSKNFPIYTEEYKDGNKTGYVIATVNTFSDLSLDHDTPMFSALPGFLYRDSTVYKQLSDSASEYIKTKKWSKKTQANKLAKEYLQSTEYKNLNLSEEMLLNEVSAFIKTLSLTIMQRSYNSSKNKN